MARERTTRRTKPLVLGIIGNGELSEKALRAHLDNLTKDRDDVTIIIPVTAESYTDSVVSALEWADANEIEFEAVVDETTGKDKSLKEVASDANQQFKTTDVPLQLVQRLDSSDIDGRLLVFWDGNDDGVGAEDATAALEIAADKDVPSFDLCRGLEVFTFNDPSGDDPADEDNVPDPEPVKRRSRRAKVDESEAQDDGDDESGDDSDDADSGGDDDDLEIPSVEELNELGVVALRRLAKELRESTAAEVKGLSKPALITLIRGEVAAQVAADHEEAQGETVTLLAGQHATQEEVELYKAVQAATEGLVKSLTALFIFEVRKPRTAGRPRKDGTPAQPRRRTATGDELKARAAAAGDGDDDDQGDDAGEAPAPRRRRGGRSV